MFYFLYCFMVLSGIFDRKGGGAYHIFQGLWCRTLVDVRCSEFEKATIDCCSNDESISTFEKLTDLKMLNYLAFLGHRAWS